MDKELYDLHIELMVKNLIHDQAAYNINYREPFNNIRDTNDYLREEIEEVEEALEVLKTDKKQLWMAIREDKPLNEQQTRLECIEEAAKELIIEVLHVAAVARKGIVQLDKKETSASAN